MNSQDNEKINLEKAKNYIENLDLSYIVAAMCAENYPMPRWIKAEADHCCQLYKNFLYLMKKHPNENLVPTREIDEFWHNHILYTKNYLRDCLQIFGHYLHHDPASPDENPEHLAINYQKTKQFYLEEYKQPLKLLQGDKL